MTAYNHLGNLYRKEKEYQKVIDAHSSAIANNPENLNAYINKVMHIFMICRIQKRVCRSLKKRSNKILKKRIYTFFLQSIIGV